MLILIPDDGFQFGKTGFVRLIPFRSLIFVVLKHLDDEGIAKEPPKQQIREYLEFVRLYLLTAVTQPGAVMPQFIPG